MTSPEPREDDLDPTPGFFGEDLEQFLDQHPEVREDHVRLARASQDRRAAQRPQRPARSLW